MRLQPIDRPLFLALLAVAFSGLVIAASILGPTFLRDYKVADEAPPTEPEPSRQEWRYEEDLHAQQDMAKWAYYLLIATWAGVGITALGVYFVKHTLDQTRKATKAAVDAAEAADRAVEVTSDTAQRQLRAYVYPIEARVVRESVNANPDFRIRFKNAGQTPAYEVFLRIRGTVGPIQGHEFAVGGQDVRRYPDMPPGEGLTCHLAVPQAALNRDLRLPYKAKTHGVFLFGQIGYFDAFGHPRTTNFRLAAKTDLGIVEDAELLTLDAGNESN